METKKLAIIGGSAVVLLVGLAAFTRFIGHGEWFTVAFACGLGAAILFAIQIGAAELLPDEMADQTRSVANCVVPSLILLLVVVSRMYPAELTLDILADRLPAAELDANEEAYAGRKVSVRGVLRVREHVWELEIADDSGAILVPDEADYDIPALGSEVIAIGTVREDPMEGWWFQVERYDVVTPADEMVAAAPE